MKAVNLIPADQRRSSNAAGKSGGAVYVLLGGLAIVVAMVAALTMTKHSIAENTAKADALDAQAQIATAKVGNLAAYKQFNEVVKTRAAGVKTLAATRIDWGETFEQVSRVVPSDVSLTQLVASTAPGQGGGSVSLRGALSNPAIEIVGCAPSQSRVALLMARLRRLEGVQRVSVASSSKQDGSGVGIQVRQRRQRLRRLPDRRPDPAVPDGRLLRDAAGLGGFDHRVRDQGRHPDPQRGHRRHHGDPRPLDPGFLT